MRPKPCKYCDQVVKYEDFDKHTSYCGSKTKKCLLCGHNVCLKDEDMHNFGGECNMFREEDKKKKELEIKRKAEEEKRIADELQRVRDLERKRVE